MSTTVVAEYLTRLLNKPLTPDAAVILSSAQRARFHAWLSANHIAFNEAVLGQSFSIDKLLGGPNSASSSAPRNSMPAIPIGIPTGQNRLGVDIQKISELFPVDLPDDLKASAELKTIFTPKELSYAQTRATPIATLTGIFAAKEAMLKCMVASTEGIPLSNYEILPDANGRPTIAGFQLSISHSGEYAVAIAQRDDAVVEVPESVNLETSSASISSVLPVPKRHQGLRTLDIVILALIVALAVLHFSR